VVLLIVTPAMLVIVLPKAWEVEPNVIPEFASIVLVTVPESANVTAVPEIFDAAIAAEALMSALTMVPSRSIVEVTEPVSPVPTRAPPEGTVAPFTEVTFGKEVVAEVMNDPLVGSVTPLIDVTPVGVALKAIVPVDVIVPPVRLVPAVMLVTDPLPPPPPAPGIHELVED
jgi:hypothetical protein